MASNGKGASLTELEKRIAKSLMDRGWRNQDIQALINSHRPKTVNFGRLASIKKDTHQAKASDEEVEFFFLHKRAYDPQTGLNHYDDERLIRAREAMILAVQIFNSAALRFKTEVFTVLAIIAWTYLLHEFYHRKGENLVGKDGNALLLSTMIGRPDCPLTQGSKDNIRAIKKLRDKVEHLTLGKADLMWQPIFQACCLNFDQTICKLFGENMTLSKDLSIALQFARLNIEQASLVNKYEIPEHIAALDAQVIEGMDEAQLANLEFQFRVVYMLDAATKSKSHFQFIKSDSEEGKKIHNVLIRTKPADELYPHRASKVVELVTQKTGIKFTLNDHTKAWRHFGVRPKPGSKQPGKTDQKFCLYHQAHGDYTYSDDWINRLVAEASDQTKLETIRAVKI